ncbi:heme anaerobic degradation radical SAM methyltransferase ChuW/HutW [Ferrimonas balearica]|uniref:heme anaerobic degradation radical SAM methyltransferase ChuW/HutW n=1 Tax=Ferrimonas balearica TaxID=44012 RepID=UPI001C94E4B1|nr:heme anaerobic degradation radical SAM methyltransferase ChuW/HutW [Ferrimonas balearica]MBY5978869.1 heme anaerobic degradation radical SAM methyltransferase ChuW/HutW [Ferrimonas balearica]
MLDLNDPQLVGQSTPDPLRYAFARKHGAHAGSDSEVVPGSQVQTALQQALDGAGQPGDTRCLYVHIPFCRVRCSYCNFFQYASSQSLIDQYFDALCREIRHKAAQPWSQAAPFQAVYIGGGTPTDLSATQLQQLGQMLRQHFPLAPDCEITLEGRVNGFDRAKFESALAGGFNRFSFGVQSFNSQVRRAARRLDDGDVVMRRIQEMVAYNSAPIVIDLLYGLPHQSLEVWQQDLADYLESGAHGVDLYQLIDMQGLPMHRQVEQGKLPPPADTATKATMFEQGVRFMAIHHQRRLSINHWARDNRERSLYNSLAKTTAEILPLGAGGGGNVAGLQMMQTRKMEDYLDAIHAERYPVPMLLRAPAGQALQGHIKAAFDHGVLSRRALERVAGDDLYPTLLPLFRAWQDNGLVTLEADYLVLTLAGQFWSVTLAQNLIRNVITLRSEHQAA